MNVYKPSEEVDRTIFMVEEVGELVSNGEVDGVEDGPPAGPCRDVGNPIDVTDHSGHEVVSGRVGRKDDFGDKVAIINKQG